MGNEKRRERRSIRTHERMKARGRTQRGLEPPSFYTRYEGICLWYMSTTSANVCALTSCVATRSIWATGSPHL
eukprot:1423784-Pleurochrysis_carterae.AAC.1